MMRTGFKSATLILLAILCAANAFGDTTHKHKKAKKPAPLPPLPSGPTGPLKSQMPLDQIPALPPQVNYQDGQLTIVAPNSTLADILRAVHKQTGAEMEIPANATERVVTNLGPGPAREVVAELLNGSRFNYVLLGSPNDMEMLTRVVLVAKSDAGSGASTTEADTGRPVNMGARPVNVGARLVAVPSPEETAEATDDSADDNPEEPDQNPAEAEQQPAGIAPTDQQQAIKTPQQLLQEMQARQMQLQQAQQQGQAGQPGGPQPGLPLPQRVQPDQQQAPQQQEQ